MKRKDVRVPRPRNGHLPAALFRKAGAHQKSTKALRRADRMSLRRNQDLAGHREPAATTGSR